MAGKRTFAPWTYSAWTFASGHWVGTGTGSGYVDGKGLNVTAYRNQPLYRASANQARYNAVDNQPRYKVSQ